VSSHTAVTAPTQFVEANSIRFAYRRWGKRSGLPLVFNHHLNGNLDNWDPAVLDGLAKEREVIILIMQALQALPVRCPPPSQEWLCRNSVKSSVALVGIEKSYDERETTHERKL